MSHSCHICGKYFSKPFNLRRRKRKVHDQKPTDSTRMATNGSAVLQQCKWLHASLQDVPKAVRLYG
jgi:hypothetical protein